MSRDVRGGRYKIPPGFPKEEEYKVPPAPEPFFDLWLLPDVPEDAPVILDRPWTALLNDRAFKKSVVMTLAKHHFWGIDWTRDPRFTINNALSCLWKLFYYMPDCNKPKSFEELFDLDRDAGPRLLGYGVRYPQPDKFKLSSQFGRGSIYNIAAFLNRGENEPLIPPQPLSIQHPNLPPAMQGGAEYDPPFSMPEDAIGMNLPPSHVRQYLFPLYRKKLPRDPWIPFEPGQRRHIVSDFPARKPLTSKHPKAAEFNETDIAALNHETTPSQKFPPLPRMGHANQQQVNTKIMETLMELTYHELQRDITAPCRGPLPSRTASHTSDLDIVEIGLHPSASKVTVELETMNISVLGEPYSYRGRGPVGSDVSPSINAVIVLGMLTEAGCTTIDRHLERDRLFDTLDKAYIEVTNMNWDCMSIELSTELRDSFHRELHSNCPGLGIGEILPPWAVWAKLTKNFAQFQFTYQDRTHHCSCETKDHLDSPVTIGSCVLPPFEENDRYGVTPGTLVGRKFGAARRWDCSKCKMVKGNGNLTERIMTRLPSRLSLLANTQTQIVNHAADFHVQYHDENGSPQTATYRWLGGIYHREGRLRVFWTEKERGREDPMTIRGYDPLSREGVIVGSIPAFGTDRVPSEWLQSAIPVLIYERVIEPHRKVLELFGANITHMLKNTAANLSALQAHTLPPRLPESGVRGVKKPLLPSLGDQYFDHQRPTPGIQLRLDPLIGNKEMNIYSMLKVNPRHTAVPILYKSVSGQWMPDLDSGSRIIRPDYELPPSIRLFNSLLNSPENYFDNPQQWSLGPVEAKETENEDIEMVDQSRQVQSAESDGLEDLWMEWINFDPDGPNKRRNTSDQSLHSRGSGDIPMTGTTLQRTRRDPPRVRPGKKDTSRAQTVGVGQRGTKNKTKR